MRISGSASSTVLTVSNDFVLRGASLSATLTYLPPFLSPGVSLSFTSFSKEKIPFYYQANSCWCPLSNSSLRRERERALGRHLTFLYSLTIGVVKAFHLWSSCGKSGSLDSLRLPVQYIYISAPIKAGQYAIPMYFLLWALPPHYNFHRHFVCKCSNRHIYHIKRDSIFFSIIHRYE